MIEWPPAWYGRCGRQLDEPQLEQPGWKQGVDLNRDDFAFSHRLRDSLGGIDRQDVVFNASALSISTWRFTEYWRAAGVAYPHGYVDRHGKTSSRYKPPPGITCQ